MRVLGIEVKGVGQSSTGTTLIELVFSRTERNFEAAEEGAEGARWR